MSVTLFCHGRSEWTAGSGSKGMISEFPVVYICTFEIQNQILHDARKDTSSHEEVSMLQFFLFMTTDTCGDYPLIY